MISDSWLKSKKSKAMRPFAFYRDFALFFQTVENAH